MSNEANVKSNDPSYNVRMSLKSEVQRLNDIFALKTESIIIQFEAEIRRIDEKIKLQSDAESRRVTEISNLRANYDQKASDLLAQQVEKSALVLSGQLDKSAETLRMLVATTAQTTQNTFDQIFDRLSKLEEAKFSRQGSGDGMKSMGAWIVSGILFLITVISFIVSFSK